MWGWAIAGVIFLIVAAGVAGILVYRNNKKRADAVIASAQDKFEKGKEIVDKVRK